MNIHKAERKQAKIRLALQGPSGSGKTYSSLLIAKDLVDDWSKIVIIDRTLHSTKECIRRFLLLVIVGKSGVI
jgi:type II secretory pathway predicted ATPase ExeA